MRILLLSIILLLTGCSEESAKDANGSTAQYEDRFPETVDFVFSKTPVVDESKAVCDEDSINICQDNLNFWIKLTNFGRLGDPLHLCLKLLESQDGQYRGTDHFYTNPKDWRNCVSQWNAESLRIYNDIRISPANISTFGDTRSLIIIRGNGVNTRPDRLFYGENPGDLIDDNGNIAFEFPEELLNTFYRDKTSWQFVIESAWVDCQNRLMHIVDRSAFNEGTLPDIFEPSPDFRQKNIIQTINTGLGDEFGAEPIISRVCGVQFIPRYKDSGRSRLYYNFGPKYFSGANGELFEVEQHTLIKKGNIRNFWIKRTDELSRRTLLHEGPSSSITYSRISINCDTGEFKYLVNNFDGNATVDPDKKWIKAKPKTAEFNYIYGDPAVEEYTPFEKKFIEKPYRGEVTYPAKARAACFL